MERRFDPEAVDLASLQRVLEGSCGAFVEGEVVGGRTGWSTVAS